MLSSLERPVNVQPAETDHILIARLTMLGGRQTDVQADRQTNEKADEKAASDCCPRPIYVMPDLSRSRQIMTTSYPLIKLNLKVGIGLGLRRIDTRSYGLDAATIDGRPFRF